jgi:hypothetical protein
VELAKMHEHRRGEFQAALDYSRAARARVLAGSLERHRRSALLAELDHRISRLEGKCARKEGPASRQAPPE